VLRTVLVAAKVVSIDNTDRSDFAASKSDPIDTTSREGIRIQQGDTRRREIFISCVEVRIADGHEVVLLRELSGDRVNTNVHDGLAQGADGNLSRSWWSGGIFVSPVTSEFLAFVRNLPVLSE
jgi:hypothetical protein